MEEKLEQIYQQLKMQNWILMLDKIGTNLANHQRNAIEREIYEKIGFNDLMFSEDKRLKQKEEQNDYTRHGNAK